MTSKQQSKLETCIATLKSANRIVWIEGINAEIIKGRIAGTACYFVRAESLNKAGGSWYYIMRWNETEWQCLCEHRGHNACKHVQAVRNHYAVIVERNRKASEFARLKAQYDIRSKEVLDGRFTPVIAGMVQEHHRLYEGRDELDQAYVERFNEQVKSAEQETRDSYMRHFYEQY